MERRLHPIRAQVPEIRILIKKRKESSMAKTITKKVEVSIQAGADVIVDLARRIPRQVLIVVEEAVSLILLR
jgi:hypothetical protein